MDFLFWWTLDYIEQNCDMIISLNWTEISRQNQWSDFIDSSLLLNENPNIEKPFSDTSFWKPTTTHECLNSRAF